MPIVDFSIIIPHKDSLDCLPRLLLSIPNSDKIEIIIVDNSTVHINKNDIGSTRCFQLLYSDPKRFAGGARNVGIEKANGTWLIFADSDDFFAPHAFDVFYSYLHSDEDLIYFKSDSVYDDTLEPSDRHLMFNAIVDSFLKGSSDEIKTKLTYLVPWGKMVRRKFILENKIRFDEILAANDVMFSTLTGYYAQKFSVDPNVVYVVTTRKGSLANREDLSVINSRYHVALKRNLFLKSHGLKKQQGSVMIYLKKSLHFGVHVFFSFLVDALKCRQNIFIGWRNWGKTIKTISLNEKKNQKYITR